MSNLAIGISGLNVAGKGLEVVGNNIANAATEGYHRQRIELAPITPIREGAIFFGRGVEVESVTRIMDNLLDKEILRQKSISECIDRELGTLRTIEAALGELSSEEGALNAAIDRFFNALRDLSAHPNDAVWQNQLVSAGDAMANEFRILADFFSDLDAQIRLEAEKTVESINALSGQIAELNESIRNLEVTGGTANNLRDQRDKLISDLTELINLETRANAEGMVDVVTAGIPLVMGSSAMEIEAGLDSNAQLGISVAGDANYRTNVTGGKIGGLISLKNELIADLRDDLDSLARALIDRINEYHIQGVGSEGSFTSLTSLMTNEPDLADLDWPVTDGNVYVRVIDTSTGEVTRSAITVDASSDTISSLAAKFDAVAGLSASVVSSRLVITADSGYKFDFLPSVLSAPTASTLTGTPPTVSVSGIYTGTTNDTFTFTVSGTGSVGNATLQLVVRDSGNNTIATLDVGSGYAAGDKLDLGNGIKIALSAGTLNDGETFEVEAFADTDTSGVLAALGINTFFSGSGASDIAVHQDISASPGRVATALGAGMTDNVNILRMAGLREQTVSDLDSLTCGDFYRRMVTDIGQKISVRQMRKDNLNQIIQNLTTRQSEISGVDINEEAANLLVFEQMFQAMAKYIATVQSSLASVVELF